MRSPSFPAGFVSLREQRIWTSRSCGKGDPQPDCLRCAVAFVCIRFHSVSVTLLHSWVCSVGNGRSGQQLQRCSDAYRWRQELPVKCNPSRPVGVFPTPLKKAEYLYDSRKNHWWFLSSTSSSDKGFELCYNIFANVFQRRFRDPNRVPRISNRVPRAREHYHRVPKIREIGSLQIHTGNLTIFFKKTPDIRWCIWCMKPERMRTNASVRTHRYNFSMDFVRPSRVVPAHKNQASTTSNSQHLEQGFPTWGTSTPGGTFAYPKGYI